MALVRQRCCEPCTSLMLTPAAGLGDVLSLFAGIGIVVGGLSLILGGSDADDPPAAPPSPPSSE